MAFGQTVADAAANQEAWIKGFRDGETRIRIVQELPTWIKYLQHFSKAAFYFPCKKTPDCVGCLYPEELNEKGEPKMSFQYAFNAVDEKGNLSVYRLGTKAFKILQSRHQRLGTVTDRDYVVVRSGKGFDTTYVPEPGDKYEVTPPERLIDILNALTLKYDEAEAATLAALAEEAAEAAEAAVSVGTTPKAAKAADEPQEAGALTIKTSDSAEAAAVQRAVEADLGAAVDQAFDPADNVDFEDLGTPDIKAWIQDHPKGEVPPRAGRAALIKIAEELKTVPRF